MVTGMLGPDLDAHAAQVGLHAARQALHALRTRVQHVRHQLPVQPSGPARLPSHARSDHPRQTLSARECVVCRPRNRGDQNPAHLGRPRLCFPSIALQKKQQDCILDNQMSVQALVAEHSSWASTWQSALRPHTWV